MRLPDEAIHCSRGSHRLRPFSGGGRNVLLQCKTGEIVMTRGMRSHHEAGNRIASLETLRTGSADSVSAQTLRTEAAVI